MNRTFRWRRELTTRHHVANGAVESPPVEMMEWLRDRRVGVIAAEPVLSLHRVRLDSLRAAAGEWLLVDIPDGEEAKSLAVAEEVWRRLLAAGFARDDKLLAVGGGAVSDLVGFVAAGYLRGVEFALIPTTTLAQVDASVGAKSGVNLDGVKNVVGAFSPPAWVLADPAVLATESLRQRRSGLVEVLKLGCVRDTGLFDLTESQWKGLEAGEAQVLESVIARAVEAKLEVVEADPTEGDLRRVLNFGHTVGHALEAVDGERTLLHGEAVAWGMLFALGLSCRRAGLSRVEADRVATLLRQLDLPPLPQATVDELLEAISRDKKQSSDGLAWVLMSRMGRHRMDTSIEVSTLARELEAFLEDPWTRAVAER